MGSPDFKLPDCPKCSNRGVLSVTYRCPVLPVWHEWCSCPAADTARKMYGENMEDTPLNRATSAHRVERSMRAMELYFKDLL